LAIKGKGRDKRWGDYIMSERFGLDWKEYESERMKEFLLITQIIDSQRSATNRK